MKRRESSFHRLAQIEHLARLVGRLRRSMVSTVTRALSEDDEPLLFWQVISAMATEGLDSQISLAERVGQDPAGTSRTLDALETEGLVRRTPDARDRRRRRVTLTAKGRRWYERHRTSVMQSLSRYFVGLTGAEQRRLGVLLERTIALGTTPESD